MSPWIVERDRPRQKEPDYRTDIQTESETDSEERKKGNLCINIVHRIQSGPIRLTVLLYTVHACRYWRACWKTSLVLFFNYFFLYDQKHTFMVWKLIFLQYYSFEFYERRWTYCGHSGHCRFVSALFTFYKNVLNLTRHVIIRFYQVLWKLSFIMHTTNVY